MILIGQYDSPFVRRVAIAMRIGRVPTLVLDDGLALLESAAILDFLDERAGNAALVPRAGRDRLVAQRRTALAVGAAEKAVSLVYETRLHDGPALVFVDRIKKQIGAALDVLEADCQAPLFWAGDRPGHADIALGCANTL